MDERVARKKMAQGREREFESDPNEVMRVSWRVSDSIFPGTDDESAFGNVKKKMFAMNGKKGMFIIYGSVAAVSCLICNVYTTLFIKKQCDYTVYNASFTCTYSLCGHVFIYARD